MIPRKFFIFLFLILIIYAITINIRNENIIEGFNTYNFVDSHVYFLDENQKGRDLRDIFPNLENTNSMAMKISGFPYLKTSHKMIPYFNSDKLLGKYIDKMDKKHKHDLFPFVCCVENSKRGFHHIKQMLETFPDLFKGIGPIYLKNNSIYRDSDLHMYVPNFKKKYEIAKKKRTNFISNKLHEYKDPSEMIRTFDDHIDIDEHYFTLITDLAKKNKLVINIDYYFDNVQNETPDLIKGLVDDEDELEYNQDLYGDDYKLIEYLEKNKDAKILLHTNVFKNRAFKIDNKLRDMNMIEYYDFLLEKFPNIIVELRGEALNNLFITEHIETKIENNNLSFVERRQKFANGLSNIRSISDVGRILFSPITNFFSGKPLTKKERETPIMKTINDDIGGIIDIEDNPVSNFIRNPSLINAPLSNKKEQERVDKLNKQNAKDQLKLNAMKAPNFNESKELNDIQKGMFEPEYDPHMTYDTDGNPEKPDCDFPIPSSVPLTKEFLRDLPCVPKIDPLKFITSQAGSSVKNISDEGNKDKPKGKKMKKYAKRMRKENKKKKREAQLTKFLKFKSAFAKFEFFEDYNLENFENFNNYENKMAQFTKQTSETAKDYAVKATTLPPNPQPPNNAPVSEFEANSNRMTDIANSVKTNQSKNLAKNISNYVQDPQSLKDIQNYAKRQADEFYGIKNGKTLLERPIELYNYGFVSYIPAKIRNRIYYVYGPPEYEYVDSDYIIYHKRRRKLEGYTDDDILNNTQKTKKMDDDIRRKGIQFYGVLDKIRNGNFDDLGENKDNIIRYFKNKKDNLRKNKDLDELYRLENETSDSKFKDRVFQKRKEKIMDDINGALEAPKSTNVVEKKTIMKYDNHTALIKKEWINLINKYPKNFVLGSGVKIDFENYSNNIVLINRVIMELDENNALDVSRNNFLRLID